MSERNTEIVKKGELFGKKNISAAAPQRERAQEKWAMDRPHTREPLERATHRGFRPAMDKNPLTVPLVSAARQAWPAALSLSRAKRPPSSATSVDRVNNDFRAPWIRALFSMHFAVSVKWITFSRAKLPDILSSQSSRQLKSLNCE